MSKYDIIVDGMEAQLRPPTIGMVPYAPKVIPLTTGVDMLVREATRDEIAMKKMLEAEGYKRTAVAVEVNLEIVPKTAYDTRVLQEDDAIEVVKFMGGG